MVMVSSLSLSFSPVAARALRQAYNGPNGRDSAGAVDSSLPERMNYARRESAALRTPECRFFD